MVKNAPRRIDQGLAGLPFPGVPLLRQVNVGDVELSREKVAVTFGCTTKSGVVS